MIRQVPKISCSLIAAINNHVSLDEVVHGLEKLSVDLLHVDITDNGPSTLCIDDIKELENSTHLPFDIHISLNNPQDILPKLKLRPQDFICFHVEKSLPAAMFSQIKQDFCCSVGIAINVSTSIEELIPYLNVVDYVLFMAAKPGVSGGQFDFDVVEKIKQFKKDFSDFKIHVDGGINHYSAAILREIGVDALVSGSYLMASNDQHQQIVKLFGKDLFAPVSEIMIAPKKTAIIKPDSSIQHVASAIQKTRMGAAFVVTNGILNGIVTDGDLRRLLIEVTNISNIVASEILTPNPFTVSAGCKLLDLIRLLEQKEKIPYAVPVTDQDSTYQGLVWVPDIFY